MKKTTLIITGFTLVMTAILFFQLTSNTTTEENKQTAKAAVGTEKDPNARVNYELNRLQNPETGFIPKNIRNKELAFAKRLAALQKSSSATGGSYYAPEDWHFAGPNNTGGRTRALAIDVSDEQVLLAGGVSGGMYRSDNQGQSWTKTTNPEQLQSITCVAQDTRTGETDTWYAGTGEFLGNSAEGAGESGYLGNGIYKSVDGGNSWDLLESTDVDSPESFVSNFQYIYNVATDPLSIDDRIYAATIGALLMSGDGGVSWYTLKGEFSDDMSKVTDVAINSSGLVYTTFSQTSYYSGEPSSDAGIFISQDGVSFEDITPDFIPVGFDRIVISIYEGNENIVYFLGHCEDYGLTDHFLFKYIHDEQNPTWVNLSDNLPYFPSNPDYNFDSQDAYDLCISIKPDDESIVLIGGTCLYRSTDGFTSLNNTAVIGGYDFDKEPLPLYENSWVDQQIIRFLPSNNDMVFIGNDGGVRRIIDILQDEPEWEPLNQDYATTQFYTIALDPTIGSDPMFLGGLQDRGCWLTEFDNIPNWELIPVAGDGSYCAITDGGNPIYISTQGGVVIRIFDEDIMTRVDPADAVGSNYVFVNPFILDPNQNSVMYQLAGDVIYRNHNLDEIPIEDNEDPTMINWEALISTQIVGDQYTAVDVSTVPANRVYAGTGFSTTVIRIDDALDNPMVTNISSDEFPVGAYVSSIAVDPEDADRVTVVFSNYEVKSIFFSSDGGENWESISGNLEENPDGSGAGPSVRWASWLTSFETKVLFVGTSVGLFSATNLDGDNTNWVYEAEDLIGNAVVDMMDIRQSDELIAVATHGIGVFYAQYSNPVFVENTDINTSITLSQNYPNPVLGETTIAFTLEKDTKISLGLYRISGEFIKEITSGAYQAGKHTITFNTSGLSAGNYIYQLRTEEDMVSKTMQVL